MVSLPKTRHGLAEDGTRVACMSRGAAAYAPVIGDPIRGHRDSLKLGSSAADNVVMGNVPLRQRTPGSHTKKVGA